MFYSPVPFVCALQGQVVDKNELKSQLLEQDTKPQIAL